MRSIIFRDLTFGTIDKPAVRPPFPRQLDECRSAAGRVNDSLDVRYFGVSATPSAARVAAKDAGALMVSLKNSTAEDPVLVRTLDP